MSASGLRAKWLPTTQTLAGFVVLCGGGLLFGRLLVNPSHLRDLIALSVACALVCAAWLAPRTAIYGLISWLALLGLLRRLATSAGATPGSFGDTMLIVAPLTIAVLFVIALRAGAMRDLTSFSKSVLALTVALGLSALNPFQGGLAVGLSGALLVVVPMLAFWVGRSLLNEAAVVRLFQLLAGLSLLAALYGLLQTFYGMPGWDAAWIAQSGYAALHVGTTVRAFGMSSSSAEYAATLGVGILAWRAIGRTPSRFFGSLAVVALLAVALWLDASRGIVVLTLAALWLTFAASRRVRMRSALLAGAAALALLPVVVGTVASPSTEHSAIASLTSRQVAGLSEPFGQRSTLGGHFTEMVNGIAKGFTDPLGLGVGATTLAATKYGGVAGNTEVDPGNAPVAAGFLGLILYLMVAAYGLSAAYRLALTQTSLAAVGALGVVSVIFLQWLNGGQYLTIALVWLLLGWIDKERATQILKSRQPQDASD